MLLTRIKSIKYIPLLILIVSIFLYLKDYLHQRMYDPINWSTGNFIRIDRSNVCKSLTNKILEITKSITKKGINRIKPI